MPLYFHLIPGRITKYYNCRELVNAVRSFIRQKYDEDTTAKSFDLVISQDNDEMLYQAKNKTNHPKTLLSCVQEQVPDETNSFLENGFSNLPEDSLRCAEPSFEELKTHFRQSKRSKNNAYLSNLYRFDAQWSQM